MSEIKKIISDSNRAVGATGKCHSAKIIKQRSVVAGTRQDESPAAGRPSLTQDLRMTNAGIIHKASRPRANASIDAKPPAPSQSHGWCAVCGASFEYYRNHQQFCSSRCRLLRWAARVIVSEYLAGRLPGLETEIARLR